MSIELKDVTFTYMEKTPFERTAIRNIHLTIGKGEFVAIIGHTGSGKSTLLQHLNGLIKPTSGEVRVEGTDIHQKGAAAKSARGKVGMVFQYPEYQLFEESIYADIAFGPRNLGLTEVEVEERVRRAMAFVDLDFSAYRDRSPFQLSGGQMRRVAIAGVIALEPEYLVLDEPSAGLDPRGRDAIFSKIYALYQKTKITVVLISHNMDDVARLADRVIVMNHGEIIVDAPPREAFALEAALRSAGVDVPQITALMRHLSASGICDDASALSADEAVREILRAVRRRNRC